MKLGLLASSLTVASLMAGAASAAPVLSSSDYAASVFISAADVVKVGTVLGAASGTAPPAYDDHGNLASINQSAVLVSGIVSAVETLTTGVVTSEAFSTLPSSATGTVSVADANFGLGTTSFGIPLSALGITADLITSSTTAGIGGSGLYSTGDSSITGLGFGGTVLGALTLDGSLYAHAAPNTVLLEALGITITLNEQGTHQDATSISMFTNALHVSLKDFLLGGKLLNGDVILGHSFASVTGNNMATSAPEPQTWAMMIVGFGFVGAMLRGRRRLARLQHA